MSMAGLTADGGAQGAVQIQFVTKRGTNAFRWQAFDEIQNDKLNANSPVNARGVPKARIRQHEFGFNLGGPIIQNRLFFFGNYEQSTCPGRRCSPHGAHAKRRRASSLLMGRPRPPISSRSRRPTASGTVDPIIGSCS